MVTTNDKKIKVKSNPNYCCPACVCDHEDGDGARNVWAENHQRILSRSSAILLAHTEAEIEKAAAELLGGK